MAKLAAKANAAPAPAQAPKVALTRTDSLKIADAIATKRGDAPAAD